MPQENLDMSPLSNPRFSAVVSHPEIQNQQFAEDYERYGQFRPCITVLGLILGVIILNGQIFYTKLMIRYED